MRLERLAIATSFSICARGSTVGMRPLPDPVLTMSVPVVAAARLLSIPVVVHEQNARPGLANRLGGSRRWRVLAGHGRARARGRSRKRGDGVHRPAVIATVCISSLLVARLAAAQTDGEDKGDVAADPLDAAGNSSSLELMTTLGNHERRAALHHHHPVALALEQR